VIGFGGLSVVFVGDVQNRYRGVIVSRYGNMWQKTLAAAPYDLTRLIQP
jgi:hypothetical protein